MDKRTAVVVGLSGVLLYGLVRLLQARAQSSARYLHNQMKVDTASEDSFPASDPPSWSPVQSTAAVSA
jgi:hypothetical protein